MMKKSSIILKINLCLFLIFAVAVTVPSIAVGLLSPSSTELIENHQRYNGKTINFEGEAIGDIMVRGDSAWIHLNDDPYGKNRSRKLAGFNSGMAIWLKTDKAKRIKILGDYNNWGDLTVVTGTFNSACSEHGGDMDIHAGSLTIIKHGEPIKHPLETGKFWWGIFLGVLAGLLFLLNKFWKR